MDAIITTIILILKINATLFNVFKKNHCKLICFSRYFKEEITELKEFHSFVRWKITKNDIIYIMYNTFLNSLHKVNTIFILSKKKLCLILRRCLYP